MSNIKDDYTTKVTHLGDGKYGARALKDGKVISEDNTATSRKEAGENLKELLRWLNKTGHVNAMAWASRARKK